MGVPLCRSAVCLEIVCPLSLENCPLILSRYHVPTCPLTVWIMYLTLSWRPLKSTYHQSTYQLLTIEELYQIRIRPSVCVFPCLSVFVYAYLSLPFFFSPGCFCPLSSVHSSFLLIICSFTWIDLDFSLM